MRCRCYNGQQTAMTHIQLICCQAECVVADISVNEQHFFGSVRVAATTFKLS